MSGRRMWINLIDEVCSYCSASVSRPNYRRHVQACKKRTPEQRTKWKSANWQRQRKREANSG